MSYSYMKTFLLQLSIFILLASQNAFAKQFSDYGRVWYIDISPSITDSSLVHAAIKSKLNTIQNQLSNSNSTNFTLLFPARTYQIQDSVLVFSFNAGINNKTLHLIGLTADLTTVQSVFSTQGDSANSTQNFFINSNLAKTNITCNNDPSTTNFLADSPTAFPVIIKMIDVPTKHKSTEFFTIANSTNQSSGSYQLNTNRINIMGLKFTDNTNDHIFYYNPPSKHPLFPFHNNATSYGSHSVLNILLLYATYIDNVIIENMWASGIRIMGEVNANAYQLNNEVIIENNIIRNIWGRNNTTVPACLGMNIIGQKDVIIQNNKVYNDLNVTKQLAGGIGICGGCELNRNVIMEHNEVCGYEYSYWLEGNTGQIAMKSNRSIGTENGLLVSRNYYYKKGIPFSANLIESNYFSNIGLDSSYEYYSAQYGFNAWRKMIFFDGNANGTEFIKLRNNTIDINESNFIKYRWFITNTSGQLQNFDFDNNTERHAIFVGQDNIEMLCNNIQVTINGTPNTSYLNPWPKGFMLGNSFNNLYKFDNSCSQKQHNNTYNNIASINGAVTPCSSNTSNSTCAIDYANTQVINGFTLKYTIHDPCSENVPTAFAYSVSGGTPGYSFSMDGHPVGYPNVSDGTVLNLDSGNHVFTITDAANVSANFQFYIDVNVFWIIKNSSVAGLINSAATNKVVFSHVNILLDSTFTINKDSVYFSDCHVYFRPGGKMIVDSNVKLFIQNSLFSSGCGQMWDGIYSSYPSSDIISTNSEFRNMENGITSTNGAKIYIKGNQFSNNYNSIQLINAPIGFNSTNNTCLIDSNMFTGNGNPLQAPHNSQSKPESCIRVIRSSEVQIGLMGSPNRANKFVNCYNGIYIVPGSQNQVHNLKIFNNLFENIKDDIQPGGAYYSTLIGNTYNTHRGAGIYAVPYSVAPLNITNLHRIVVNGNQNVVSFSNCDKAIVTSYFGANIQNTQTSGTPLGFMFGNADGQYIEAGNVISQLGGGQHNILNGVMIGIQVLGNTSKTFINDNEINLSGDYYLNGPISTLYYWAQGIILRPFNSPTTPYEINQNQINIPNLGGTGISISNAGKGLRVFNNEIRFQTTSAAPDNSCGWCRAELVGIEMSNSRDGMLEANKVYGFTDASGQPLVNVFNERNAFALRMFHSRDIGLKCNETHKTRYGFYVVGDCSHADPLTVTGNVFDYHASGMLFNHLGSEGTFGNISDQNHDNNNQFTNSSQPLGATQLREVWRITNSIAFNGEIYTQLLTQNQSGSNLGIAGAYKIQIPNQNHTLLSCEDLPLEIEEDGLSPSEIQEAMQIAGDSINYSEYTDLSEWYDERQVYEWLRRDSVARVTYPLLNAFYANQESLLTDEIRSLDVNMDILCQENTLNDSTTFQNKLLELSQENTALPLGRLFENYEKDLNRIYLNVLTQGWQDLSTADFEQLEELALSCPFVNGSAVYKARSLYAHIQPGLSYSDLEICNAVGVFKNGVGTTSIENRFGEEFSVLIYPNPANEQIQIQTSLSDGIINIRVYDMTGQLVQTANLVISNGTTVLPLTAIGAGVYNLQIESNNQIKYSKFIKL